MQAQEPVVILDGKQIEQKINRLAYQIYENHFDQKELVVCGIAERGFQLAQKIYAKLGEIASFQLELASITLDKDNPTAMQPQLNPLPERIADKTVILCDDVLYTGKTLAYAAIPFLQAGVKELQCLVLIQRNHLNFPIQPAYIGMSLATTIQDHVTVNFNGDESVSLG